MVSDRSGDILGTLKLFNPVFCQELYVNCLIVQSPKDFGSSGNFICGYYWRSSMYIWMLTMDNNSYQFVDRCSSFFFWPLCYLPFFDLQILITPLVSANFLHFRTTVMPTMAAIGLVNKLVNDFLRRSYQ
jgi:hypothetical protein